MTRRLLRQLLALLLLTTCAGVLLFAAAEVVRFYGTSFRGVSFGLAPGVSVPAGPRYGVNVRLTEEAPETAPALLGKAAAAGYGWVRQEFAWADFEPARDELKWRDADLIVDLAASRGLRLIAVVTTSPAWARSNDARTSPPDDAADLARFMGRLAERYRGRIAAYQIWDEPNIAPNWGPRYASAAEYAHLLQAAYAAGKAADPGAVFLSAALAPTTEQSERNQSDVLYLQGMYRAGAKGSFDAVAAKPYGFWTGPEDRRAEPGVLNFSRLVLLREVMDRNGDGGKAIWAVEMGWNALPAGWQGQPSPWGSDSEAKQVQRTVEALARARTEWPWLTVAILPALRYPAAPADDPVRGFALLNDDLSPRAVFSAVTEAAIAAKARALPELQAELGQYLALLVLLVLGLALSGWLLAVRLVELPWASWLGGLTALPEVAQAGALAAALAVYQASPWQVGSLAAGAALGGLSLLRPDLGLVAAAAAIPFAYLPRRLVGSWEFSALEILTVACAGGWILRCAVTRLRFDKGQSEGGEDVGAFWRRLWAGLTFADRGVLLWVLLGTASLAAAADPRGAARELRLVVLEPALLYLLVTRASPAWRLAGRRLAWWMAGALAAGGVTAASIGLFQYAFTNRVITAEGGLRRMLGPYPSPNALGLLLERVLPLLLSLALAAWLAGGLRRGRGWAVALGAALLTVGAGVVLTFSVGAWGAAAVGCAVVAVRQQRRVALALAGAALAGAVLALPLMRTERVASHFDLQSVTTSAVRVAVWQSAVEMVQDHPVTGVGLDGFLELYRTRYIRPEAWREPDLSHPHNLVLEAWLSLGILGPLVYGVLIAALLRLAWRLRRAGSAWQQALVLGLAAAALAGVAHGLVDRYLAGAPDLSAVFLVTLGVLQILKRATPAGAAGRSTGSDQRHPRVARWMETMP